MAAEEQPLMNERLRSAFQKKAAPLLEPDEQVIMAIPNLTLPAWIYLLSITIVGALFILPYAIQKASLAVVTQTNVYVFRTTVLGAAKRVLLKSPLGSVEASYGGGAFPGRFLMIGEHKLWLAFASTVQRRAQLMAQAASSGPAVLSAGAAAEEASAE